MSHNSVAYMKSKTCDILPSFIHSLLSLHHPGLSHLIDNCNLSDAIDIQMK